MSCMDVAVHSASSVVRARRCWKVSTCCR